jgi:hypothetical protein
MSDYIFAAGIDGTKPGVYRLLFDPDAGTLVDDIYLSNTSISGSFTSYLVQISPLDNQIYVAGAYTGGKTRIYKMSQSLVVDSTWGSGAGYAEYTSAIISPSGTRGAMSIGLDGTILISSAESNSTNTVNVIESDGTLRWQGKAWDNNGNRDVTSMKGGLILPNGNICVLGAVGSGEKPVCIMAKADGAYVNSYSPTITSMSSAALTISSDGDIYIAHYASSNSTLYKTAYTNFSSVDFTETAVDCIYDYSVITSHSANGDLYTGRRYDGGVADTKVYRLSGSNGSIVSSYEYGVSGFPLGSCELPSGNIFYAVSTGATTGFVLGEDMSHKADASLTDSPSFFYHPVSVLAPIISSSSPTDLMYNRKLVAFSGDSVYYESDSSGTMTEVTETGGGIGEAAADTFDMTESLTAADAYQKIFVANNATLAVVDFVNTRISASTAFTNVSLVNHGTLLYQNSTDPATILVDTVLGSSVSSNTMVGTILAGTISTATDIRTASGGGGDVVVVDGTNAISIFSSVPFLYNHTPSASPTLATGAMPEAATLVCRYRGRIVYSGNPNYPYQWYMARQADPFDFLYVVNDAQAPVAGADADAGQIGDIIQCLIPRGDDYLIFGCSNSVWLMRGDPAAGGSLDELTTTTGIYGPRSWCFDDAGFLYFWGRGGIYRMPPNFSGVENITATVLPNIVGDEAPNKSTHRIVMDYDRERLIVKVFITKMSDGSNSNYVYDIRTQGFFPESYSNNIGVFSAHYYEAIDPSYQKLYTGHYDSFIRYEDDDKKDDAGYSGDAAISSHAVIGPLQIGRDASARGRMKTMSITTGTDTDGVTYDIHVADSAEEVVDDSLSGATPLHTGTISAGNRVQQIRPRSRGAWMGIKLENTAATETWQFEKLVADVKPAGDIK